MIISDEQARAAAECLRCSMTGTSPHVDVDPAVIAQATSFALGAPDLRDDRVAQARDRMIAGVPSARDIASKMVSRVLSDSLR